MKCLNLRLNEAVIDSTSFTVLVSARRIKFYRGKELQREGLLCPSFKSKFWSFECLQFLIKVLETTSEVEELNLASVELGFMVTFALKDLGYPYILDGIESVPVSEWHLVFNCSGVKNSDSLLSSMLLPNGYRRIDRNPGEFLECNIRVLIVAYYGDPYGGVGSKRPKFLNKFFNVKDGVSSKLVSAISSDDLDTDIVPDFGFDDYQHSNDEVICSLVEEGISIVGASWSDSLKEYFDSVYRGAGAITPNVIVFSGNPFYYFSLAGYVKNRYGVFSVLDYRDPFANNPLMLRSAGASQNQKKLESSFNQNADLICVVNQQCVDLLEGDLDPSKVIVVENGYDENLYQDSSSTRNEKLTFVYAGSFSKFRSGSNFENALASTHFVMNYLGSDVAFGASTPQITRFGHVPIDKAAKIIQTSDVGVVFATGEAFESTTKIYDYIGAGLPILIVTSGPLRCGALNDLVDGLDEVYWVENDLKKIKSFLGSFKPNRPCRPEVEKYTRGFQAKILLDRIIGALDAK